MGVLCSRRCHWEMYCMVGLAVGLPCRPVRIGGSRGGRSTPLFLVKSPTFQCYSRLRHSCSHGSTMLVTPTSWSDPPFFTAADTPAMQSQLCSWCLPNQSKIICTGECSTSMQYIKFNYYLYLVVRQLDKVLLHPRDGLCVVGHILASMLQWVQYVYRVPGVQQYPIWLPG